MPTLQALHLAMGAPPSNPLLCELAGLDLLCSSLGLDTDPQTLICSA